MSVLGRLDSAAIQPSRAADPAVPSDVREGVSRIDATDADSQPQEDSISYLLSTRKSFEVLAGGTGALDATTTTSQSDLGGASTAAQRRELPHSIASNLSRSSTEKSNARRLKMRTEWMRDVSIQDEQIRGLIEEVRALSLREFDEDCVEDITKKSRWKLSLLVSEGRQQLCGFVTHNISTLSLSVAKIAVSEPLRGRGFGKLMMEDLMKAARKRGEVYEVGLSALPNSVSFYLRLGFKAYVGLKLSYESYGDGQVYMEKKLRIRPKRHARFWTPEEALGLAA